MTRSAGRRLGRKTTLKRAPSHAPSLSRSILNKAKNWNLGSVLYRLYASSSISVPQKSIEGFDGPTDTVRPFSTFHSLLSTCLSH